MTAADFRRAAAVLRARAWWVTDPDASYAMRIQADTLDARAKGLEGRS